MARQGPFTRSARAPDGGTAVTTAISRRALLRGGGAAALALSSASVVAACGGDSGESAGGEAVIKFTSWAYAEDATRDKIKALIDKFQAQHPTIKVQLQAVSFTDIAHQVLLEAQAGNAPDVVQTAGNDMLTEAEAGILRPLGELADKAYLDGVLPEALKLCQVNGDQVAVPWTVAPFGFWYNKKLMAQAGLDPAMPPATIDQLLAHLATIKAKLPGVIPIGIDATNRSFGLDCNWPVMTTFGAQPFNGSTASADTPAMREYLSFMRTLAQQGYTQVNKKLGEFRPVAAANKVAFMWDGPYLQATMQATNHASDDEIYNTWGVTKLPAGPSGKSTTTPTDHALAVLKTTKRPQAAWELVKFLTSAPDAFDFQRANGIPPLAKPTGEAAKTLDTPIVNAYRETVIPTVERPPWGSTYSKVYSPIMAAVQTAMTSTTSLDQVVAQMQSQISSAMR